MYDGEPNENFAKPPECDALRTWLLTCFVTRRALPIPVIQSASGETSVMASLAAQRFSAVLRIKRPLVVRPTRTYVAVALRNSVSRPTVLAKPAAVLLHRAQIATESETAKGEKVENNNNGNNTTALEGSPAAGIPPNFVSDMDGTGSGGPTDWSKSYHGLSSQAFSKEIAEILLSPVNPMDIEIKPGKHRFCFLDFISVTPLSDGLIYLPEIKYRRVLNKAFGPGAWGLAPRSQTNVSPKIVSREYALVCQGRLVCLLLMLLYTLSRA